MKAIEKFCDGLNNHVPDDLKSDNPFKEYLGDLLYIEHSRLSEPLDPDSALLPNNGRQFVLSTKTHSGETVAVVLGMFTLWRMLNFLQKHDKELAGWFADEFDVGNLR